MAHLSLYRKFRPDTFEKMVRQEHVVRILKNQIESGTVGHAYLFTGPRGTGKTSVARIFARAVNCEHPVHGNPCGKCATCKALESGSLDISEIDAASNNGVNEMRDLREKVQYPPVSGKYKVYIIDEVHMLTDSAFNALLKTLEEPPAHALFILATTEPQKIPATILSRCMRLDFKLIPTEDLVNHLKGILDDMKKPYEEEAVEAIARAGAGSDRDMLSIAEMCLAYSETLTYEGVTAVLGAADFKETCDLAGKLIAADLGSALSAAEKMIARGRAVGVLCRDLLQALNMIAIAKSCKNAEALLAVPKEHFRMVQKIAEAADGRAILRVTEVFVKLEPELRYATSPRIAFETAVMRATLPKGELDLDALTVRVNHVENRLKDGVMLLQKEDEEQEPPAIQEMPAPKKEEKAEEEPPYDAYDFPTEEPIFAEAYFSDEPAPAPVKPKKEQPKTEKAIEPAQKSAPVQESTPSEGKMSAEMAFGKFVRTLRKTLKNGVLFTMCSDLEPQYEGDTLVLNTDSETVYRSLTRDENRTLIADVLTGLGVSAYEIRLRSAAASEKDGIEQIKKDFSDYPIEIK